MIGAGVSGRLRLAGMPRYGQGVNGAPAPQNTRRQMLSASGRSRLLEAANLADVARFRAAAYRVLAALFLDPNERRLAWLSGVPDALEPFDDTLATLAFQASWRRLIAILQAPEALDLDALGCEHVRLFSIGPGGTPCFPYESHQLGLSGEEAGWLVARLEVTYAAAGLHLGDVVGQRPDHVAVQLEFMAFLCAAEADEWERPARAAAVEALAHGRSFLRLHLGHWFSGFARDVEERSVEPLYRAAAGAACAFIEHDRDLVEALVDELQGVGEPSRAG